MSLKEGARGTSSGARSARVRNFLVIAETALSLILLVGAGLMLRSFQRLLAVNPGFNPDRVLTLRVPLPAAITAKPQQPLYYTRILDRLASLPGLNSAGLIAPLPAGRRRRQLHLRGGGSSPAQRRTPAREAAHRQSRILPRHGYRSAARTHFR